MKKIIMCLAVAASIFAYGEDDLSDLLEKANNGDAFSQYILHLKYRSLEVKSVMSTGYVADERAEKYSDEAAKWLRESAMNGYPGAVEKLQKILHPHSLEDNDIKNLYSLGHYYLRQNTVVDAQIALCLFRKAAELGLLEGRIVVMRLSGNLKSEATTVLTAEWNQKQNSHYGYSKEARAIRERLLRAIEDGDSQAKFELGWAYAHGNDEHRKQGIKWLREAGEQGVVNAFFALGLLSCDLTEEDVNINDALQWLRRAGDEGHTLAQITLASILYHRFYGSGMKKNEAIKWLCRAAKNGNMEAQYSVIKLQKKHSKLVMKETTQTELNQMQKNIAEADETTKEYLQCADKLFLL